MPGSTPQQPGKRKATMWNRLGWFALIWLISISALGIVAYAIWLLIP